MLIRRTITAAAAALLALAAVPARAQDAPAPSPAAVAACVRARLAVLQARIRTATGAELDAIEEELPLVEMVCVVRLAQPVRLAALVDALHTWARPSAASSPVRFVPPFRIVQASCASALGRLSRATVMTTVDARLTATLKTAGC
jgi:hypothetical protein